MSRKFLWTLADLHSRNFHGYYHFLVSHSPRKLSVSFPSTTITRHQFCRVPKLKRQLRKTGNSWLEDFSLFFLTHESLAFASIFFQFHFFYLLSSDTKKETREKMFIYLHFVFRGLSNVINFRLKLQTNALVCLC